MLKNTKYKRCEECGDLANVKQLSSIHFEVRCTNPDCLTVTVVKDEWWKNTPEQSLKNNRM